MSVKVLDQHLTVENKEDTSLKWQRLKL